MKLGEGRIVKEVVREAIYESGKQSKVGKRPGDRLVEVWMERFGHRSLEWVINE